MSRGRADLAPSSLFDKLWALHRIAELDDGATLLHIDRVFLHERTGGVALQSLAEAGHPVHRPRQAFATLDHIVDTLPGRAGRGDRTLMPGGEAFIRTTREATRAHGIRLFDLDDPDQGIVHVVSPEQGIVLPGLSLVCPDSHTCTQGAFGALAWGVGSSEAEHALATQTLRATRPRSMRVWFDGQLPVGVGAKDMILALIARDGASGARGAVVEFAGEAVRALSMEARMTLCNMAVEFSAFTGLVAPDDCTFDYLAGRPHAPQGALWPQAVAAWRCLHSDEGAAFDAESRLALDQLGPMLTWGTSPQHASAIDAVVPAPESSRDAAAAQAAATALDYMGLTPGQRLAGLPIDVAFIGSCTNSRLSDLRAAAELLRGRRVAPGVRALCVPGSGAVKRAAEAEGLHQVFLDAGFEWREPGCSMCFFAGGEQFGRQQRVVSTTNRNFEGRQGPGVRTHLASPVTVAASAIAGCLADPRALLRTP
ncbi:3-isopropylmalate dehydratase large subunit [Aquabacterium sp. OR-4]|uniref:3-isopropylmalate dehydratase large subunit n=1 Tax=Aquabacterium sp. OR-4 TaxID=2978127 RepID=UPI0021B2CF65|nr:3-isopropylmalate dehydratase large subunit [Aquabacterium sp. OR-4]MDT7836930.1 3-isopropylmalate dehydratase large subunit [Aquabacterium sp. OR-4]